MNNLNYYAEKSRAIKVTSTKTRLDDTIAYTAGDVIGSNDWIFDFEGYANAFDLKSVILRIDISSLPSGMTGFKLHLYDDVTAVQLVDNVPQTFLTADKAKYLGTIALSTPVDKGDFLFSMTKGINEQFILKKGSNKIYARLETDGGFTPSSADVYNLALNCVCN
ncbi:MAG: hypothetical protein ACRCW9_03910 [Cetobacterium sp.]